MLGSEGGENRVQNRPKTSLSTPGFCNLFPPSLSLRRSSYWPRPPPATPHEANTTTNRPPSSYCGSLSLLLPAFLSPLQPFLLPPTADSGHHHLSRRLLSHRPNHLIMPETPRRQLSPPCFASFFLVVAAACSS